MTRVPSATNFGPSDFQRETGVDDATLDKFRLYETLVKRWNEQAGLVGESTLPHIWHRHFLDSAQMEALIPKTGAKNPVRVADLGSGAGFPGLVLALLGVPHISLFERNTRKAGFLQEAAKELGVEVEVMNLTTEDFGGEPFDIITARALASLDDLFVLSRRLRKPSTVCLFLKGKSLDDEIREAQKDWSLTDLRRIQSITDPDSAILRLTSPKLVK
jgi:16S rRNA (guanine527-N7)-methyltransferase